MWRERCKRSCGYRVGRAAAARPAPARLPARPALRRTLALPDALPQPATRIRCPRSINRPLCARNATRATNPRLVLRSHRSRTAPTGPFLPATKSNRNIEIGTSGTRSKFVRNVKSLGIDTLPTRSNSTCPLNATTMSGNLRAGFLTKYADPRSGSRSNGVTATADPIRACPHRCARNSSSVHARLTTANREFNAFGNVTRTPRFAASPGAIRNVADNGVVNPLRVRPLRPTRNPNRGLNANAPQSPT